VAGAGLASSGIKQRQKGFGMAEESPTRAELTALRDQRELLELQIKQSQRTIEHSLEVIRRIDEILAKTSSSSLG
jgi:hypothetical protein